MMWLPQQTIAQWLESVDALIALGPDHASLYMLELYPNAPLRDAMARGKWSLAPDDDAADMYCRGDGAAGHGGIPAVRDLQRRAGPAATSRHNLKYWTDGEWLGFGCGAHSTRHGVRWKNLSSTTEYISAATGGGQLATDRRVLSEQERFEETVFTGLRLVRGIDVELIESRYGVDLWRRYGDQLQPFVDHALLIYDGGGMRLTRAGMLLAHEVMAVFIN